MLLRTKAKDRAGKDLSIDRDVVDAYDYFKQHNEKQYICEAAYYSALVMDKNKMYDFAAKYYHEALEIANKKQNKDYKAQILFVYGKMLY